ncbi:MAG: hypothetical protein AAB421_05035 [Patescibacteria group bacterium]
MSNLLRESKKELSMAFIVMLLLVLLLNPFDVVMLSRAAMLIVLLLFIAFVVFATLVWREGSYTDERDSAHQATAGRMAYLAGASVLCIGIIISALQHSIEPTLLIALGTMVIAKIISSLYTRFYN